MIKPKAGPGGSAIKQQASPVGGAETGSPKKTKKTKTASPAAEKRAPAKVEAAARDVGPSEPDAREQAKRRAELIGLFEALPHDEQQAAMVDLLRRRQQIAPMREAPKVLDPRDPVAPAFWANALAEHRLGKPERLASMVERCAPLIGLAGSYLAEIVRSTAKRGMPGRPSKRDDYPRDKMQSILQEHFDAHHFKLEFTRCRDNWAQISRQQRTGTPSDLAIDEMALRHNLAESEVRRRIYGRSATQRKRR